MVVTCPSRTLKTNHKVEFVHDMLRNADLVLSLLLKIEGD